MIEQNPLKQVSTVDLVDELHDRIERQQEEIKRLKSLQREAHILITDIIDKETKETKGLKITEGETQHINATPENGIFIRFPQIEYDEVEE